MLLLGLFLLIAKCTNHELWGEGESGGTRRGEGLQRGAELPGKEKEKLKLKGKEKERRRENGVSDKEKYNFKDSGIGDSWLIGTDTTNWPNAYVNYLNGCEETLIIPHNLTDDSGNTKKVEVIGQYAFNNCGNKDATNGITRSIVLSRYIKVIKRY